MVFKSWKRIQDMHDDKGKKITNPVVISDGFGANDIGQGQLGDGWLLSAFSVVAFNRPDLLKKLIHSKCRGYNKNGMYVIRFFKMGAQKIVHVDDKFPCNSQGKSVFCKVSSSGDQTEFWPVLLEKAYAKLHYGYDSISAGRPEQGLVDLTNGISELISFSGEEFRQMKNNGTFWQKLMNSVKNNDLLAASSNGNSDAVSTEKGIVEGHAYGVLDAQEIDGFQLVQLRNPWGDSEWKGEWSDYDTDNWTESRKRRIDDKQRTRGRNPLEIGVEDGAFWMSLSDFLANFVSLSIVKIYEAPEWYKTTVTSKWNGASAGGGPNFPNTYCNNPQFKITVKKSTPAIIYMQQFDKRGLGR